MKKIILISLLTASLFFGPLTANAQPAAFPQKVPSSVLDLSRENTIPNHPAETTHLVPEQSTRTLLKTAGLPIENVRLIQLLNQSELHPSRWSIGYHARIYLGHWPLNYTSEQTSVRWAFQKINDNAIDARGSDSAQNISYVQKNRAEVKGELETAVHGKRQAALLVLNKVRQKTKLPVSFKAVIGSGTKLNRPYSVQPKQIGSLSAYVPAVSDKGSITSGEVFLILTGGQAKIEVKNIVRQEVSAWLPLQNRLYFQYSAR